MKMETTDILKIIAELIGGLFAVLFAYIAPKFKAWLVSKVGEAQANRLYADVTVLVKAAEQMYWNKTGAERKEYVLEQLTKLGYTLTDEVNNIIESTVFELPGDKNEG